MLNFGVSKLLYIYYTHAVDSLYWIKKYINSQVRALKFKFSSNIHQICESDWIARFKCLGLIFHFNTPNRISLAANPTAKFLKRTHKSSLTPLRGGIRTPFIGRSNTNSPMCYRVASSTYDKQSPLYLYSYMHDILNIHPPDTLRRISI